MKETLLIIEKEIKLLLNTNKDIAKTRNTSLAYTALEKAFLFVGELRNELEYNKMVGAGEKFKITDTKEGLQVVIDSLYVIRKDFTSCLQGVFTEGDLNGVTASYITNKLMEAKLYFGKHQMGLVGPVESKVDITKGVINEKTIAKSKAVLSEK